MAGQINLINEPELTDFVNRFVYVGSLPIIKRFLKDERGLPIISAKAVAESRNIISNIQSNNRDYLSKNSKLIIQYFIIKYLKQQMRTYLNKYIDTEFITEIDLNENLSEHQKAQIATGINYYKFNKDRIPKELEIYIGKLIKVLNSNLNEYLNSQLNNKDGFSIDMNYLNKRFPDLNTVTLNKNWDKARKIVIEQISKIIPIFKPKSEIEK